MDVRKPVKTFAANSAESNAIEDTIHEHLFTATENGTREIGCTGLSFVILSMGIWMRELHSIDPTATKKFLDALATIADPSAPKRTKFQAEQARQRAVRNLMATADLHMAQPGGTA